MRAFFDTRPRTGRASPAAVQASLAAARLHKAIRLLAGITPDERTQLILESNRINAGAASAAEADSRARAMLIALRENGGTHA